LIHWRRWPRWSSLECSRPCQGRGRRFKSGPGRSRISAYLSRTWEYPRGPLVSTAVRCIGCEGPLPAGRTNYCCAGCAESALGLIRPRRPFDCPGCGRTVLVLSRWWSRRKFCSRSCARATYNRHHLTGSRNGRWRGGRVLSYGPDWKKIKARVRERDGVCRCCGKTPGENGRALDVHHLDPYRFSGDNDLENLLALCRSCHMRADDHGRRGSARFAGPIQLTFKPPSRRELRRERGEAQRKRRRELKDQAVVLTAEGKSLRQIARALGVSHQTISNWITGRYVSEDSPPYLAA
jgi:HNH endonuclease/helix-turn-helix protein